MVEFIGKVSGGVIGVLIGISSPKGISPFKPCSGTTVGCGACVAVTAGLDPCVTVAPGYS